MTEAVKNLVKGTRVRARWFKVKQPLSSLAGFQMKVTGDFIEVEGTIRHFRGDHPVRPTVVMIYLDVDVVPPGVELVQAYGCACEKGHVEVKQEWIVAVLGGEGAEVQITCPRCGMTSWNPNDVDKKYCGNCDKFHDDP